MIFGKAVGDGTYSPLFLQGCELDFVSEYKYLGTTVTAGKSLSFSAISDLRSFHRASNAIFYSPVKPHEQILMTLLYTNCVPILSYACAVKEYSPSNMSDCNTAINNAIRKIFSFSRTESVRHLRSCFGHNSIYEIFATAKNKFLKTASSSTNCVISHLSKL